MIICTRHQCTTVDKPLFVCFSFYLVPLCCVDALYQKTQQTQKHPPLLLVFPLSKVQVFF